MNFEELSRDFNRFHRQSDLIFLTKSGLLLKFAKANFNVPRIERSH
ncbi:hypothetical protein CKA32_004001 [Geitlerinema sp. FC II]|nr:hypothetical protein CKA32_004001 [Geitlerinema sp. FC II]